MKNSDKNLNKDEIEEETKNEDEDTQIKKIEELEKKLSEQEDKYLRAYADFDNTKKRLEKEKYQAIEYAKEGFATDLLSVIDSLEMALNSVSNVEEFNKETFDNMEKGIALTNEQLKKVFNKHHIEEINISKEFDPHFHQAVIQEESDKHNVGEIVKILQKGYKLKDRILRPSMVSTCKGNSTQDSNES